MSRPGPGVAGSWTESTPILCGATINGQPDRYKSVYTEVEVDVDLGDFETDDLLEELESRGSLPPEGNVDAKELIEQMYYLRRQGQAYEHLLDPLIYSVLGRIV
jgi:hypothetical protein